MPLINLDLPISQIAHPVFPWDQKIRSRPVRPPLLIALTALLTAEILYIKRVSLWKWPVAIVATTTLCYAVIKFFGWDKDPLIEAFYTIAGNKGAYDALPLFWQFSLDKTAPLFRIVTPDGRKGLIINGQNDKVQEITACIERISVGDIFHFNHQFLKELHDPLLYPGFSIQRQGFIETNLANRVIAQRNDPIEALD